MEIILDCDEVIHKISQDGIVVKMEVCAPDQTLGARPTARCCQCSSKGVRRGLCCQELIVY